MLNVVEFSLVGPEATDALGRQLAEVVCAPMRIYLSGPLGAGKTSLVRACLRGLGVQGAIKSPSYALVEPYILSSYSIYHFDFYRFFDENEWADSGFRDYFESKDAVCIVEWPEKAGSTLPEADLKIDLSYAKGEATIGFLQSEVGSENLPAQVGRTARLTAQTDAGLRVLEKMRHKEKQA